MILASTQAEIALRSLHPQDRDRVLMSIRMLDQSPKREFIPQDAKKLKGHDDLYLMRVTPELRIIFRPRDGKDYEVVDIIAHSGLENMRRYIHQP